MAPEDHGVALECSNLDVLCFACVSVSLSSADKILARSLGQVRSDMAASSSCSSWQGPLV